MKLKFFLPALFVVALAFNAHAQTAQQFIDSCSVPINCTLTGNRYVAANNYMLQVSAGHYVMSVGAPAAAVFDGRTRVQRSGNEYSQIENVLRLNMQPGTTTDTTWNSAPLVSVRPSFMGMVSDSTIGASTIMIDDRGLKAYKSNFFIADMMVCLGAGITAPDKKHVVTTIDQRAYNSKTGKQIKGENWIWHDGTGFFFPDRSNPPKAILPNAKPLKISASTNTASPADSIATWYISHTYTDKYVYMIKPAAGLVETRKMAWKLPVRVISNTAQVQAVRTNEVIMAVFYQPGSVYLNEGIRLEADQPCMLICRKAKGGYDIYAADPSRKLQQLNIYLGKTAFKVDLPQGDAAGTTVHVPKS